MPGRGKYTSFVGGAAPTSAHKQLSRLFPNHPLAKQVENADESGALKDVILPAATKPVDAAGVGGLVPSDGVQKGDQLMLGNVKINFSDAPNLADVKHDTATSPSGNKAGGPATAYFPDITSPGPGKTDGVDKADDPMISIDDLAAGLSKPDQPSHLAGYVPGGPTTGTRTPSATSAKVVEANTLGNSGIPGSSNGKA